MTTSDLDPVAALDRHVVPSVRRRVESLVEDLHVWREGGNEAIPLVLSELRELLDLNAAASYRLSPRPDGWGLDYLAWHGDEDQSAVEAAWMDAVRLRADEPCLYDPARPKRAHRNRPRRPIAFYGEQYERTAVRSMLSTLGIDDVDELRVLVCDGPALLGWIGGWRDEDFGRRDAAILAALVPALRTRMRLERDLGECSLRLAALVAALEAISAAAFLVDGRGNIVLTNAPGRASFEAGYRALREALRAAVDRPAQSPGYRVTPVTAKGASLNHLVVRTANGDELERRCDHARSRWRLTPRELEVMRLVVEGNPNSAIATKLSCSLRNVELHVTNILAKSGTRRRTELSAKFFSNT